MRKQQQRGLVALTKRDLGFLSFLDQPFSHGSKIRLDQRDRLRAILSLFEIIFSLISIVSKSLKRKKVPVADTALENLARAITGEFPDVSIDYSRISILNGKLAAPCGSMFVVPETDKLDFSWATCTQMNSHGSDELMAMMFCPASRDFWFEPNLGITRKEGFCTVDVPEEFRKKETHVWLAYRSADGNELSDSSYMGCCGIPITRHGNNGKD